MNLRKRFIGQQAQLWSKALDGGTALVSKFEKPGRQVVRKAGLPREEEPNKNSVYPSTVPEEMSLIVPKCHKLVRSPNCVE